MKTAMIGDHDLECASLRLRILDQLAAERQHQIHENGWTPAHDDQHAAGELALCAIHCAQPPLFPLRNCSVVVEDRRADCVIYRPVWPFDGLPAKDKGYRQNLIRAAALLVAEIERLDRAEARVARREQKINQEDRP